MLDELKAERYVSMDDETKIEKSHAFFANLQERYAYAEKHFSYYCAEINRLLCEKADYETLVSLMRKEECRKICVFYDQYVNSMFWLTIAQKEQIFQCEISIHGFNSIEEADEILKKIHFYLRRIEFDWEEREYRDIVGLIQRYRISYVALAEICSRTDYKRPVHISCRLAETMAENGLKVEATRFLALVHAYIEDDAWGKDLIVNLMNTMVGRA